MKRRVIAVFLLILMTVSLVGCEFSLPFLSKPEDAVKDLMSQESLMERLSLFDDYSAEKDDDIYTLFWVEVLSSPSMKSLFLDNVRSISYNITNTSNYGDSATVTALITHLDISPVIDRAIEVFFEKLIEMDATGATVPEDEAELANFFASLMLQSLKEAAAKTKPSETYSKIRFDCVKTSGVWEIKEVPDEFIENVLLMNFPSALEDAFINSDYFN